MSSLKRTPLYPLYQELGGKTIDFGGWDLPVQFPAGITKEHEAVRTAAGVFDVSHMGEVYITGTDALAFVQRITTNDASKLSIGQAQYSLMCNHDGGVVDDLLVYRTGELSFMLVINASNITKDLAWMHAHVNGDAKIQDASDQTALIALQGPHAEAILQSLTDVTLSSLPGFHFLMNVSIAGVTGIVSRTGYTGEDGFEIYLDSADADPLFRAILAAGEPFGILPCGLGARDTLRFEAALPLYGQELSDEITPLEAGLGFFVKLDKADFIGKDVLVEQKKKGLKRKRVGVEMIERGIPRAHYKIHDGSRVIGEITTGTQSPTLKKNVGMAIIEADYAGIGSVIEVDIRGKILQAEICPLPFYKRKKGNSK